MEKDGGRSVGKKGGVADKCQILGKDPMALRTIASLRVTHSETAQANEQGCRCVPERLQSESSRRCGFYLRPHLEQRKEGGTLVFADSRDQNSPIDAQTRRR